MIKKLLTYLLCLLAFTTTYADNPSYDIRTFDISGVKLGMNTQQAVNALTSSLNIDKSKIQFQKFIPENPVLKKKVPNYFSYKDGTTEITVHFKPAIPVDDQNPMRVHMVTYKLPYSNENTRMIRDKAFEKYGMPTSGYHENHHIGHSYTWCQLDNSKKVSNCTNSGGANLKKSATELKLYDPSYHEKVFQYLNQKKTVTPKF